jgi:mannose-6-phosphate isomerase-like protein (cupin superfamily)
MSTVEATENKAAPRGADKKEAFHRDAEARREPFKFRRPDVELKKQKAVHYLCESDIVKATVQIIPEGGDNRLHYHPGADGFWMVLQGRIRFYGPDGVIGEYGPHEGILMPRNARYWFESADLSVELHLLYVAALTQEKVQNFYVPLEPKKPDHKPNLRFNYPPGKLPV